MRFFVAGIVLCGVVQVCAVVSVRAQKSAALLRTKSSAEARRATASSAAPLQFREFFELAADELKPSAKLLSLDGKRVRIVGFMAQMELPPSGAFYLVPRPVYATEAGAGTADLPPDAVLVVARSARDREIEFVARPLEVTGVLKLGPHAAGGEEEVAGHPSSIRIILDGPPRQQQWRRQSTSRSSTDNERPAARSKKTRR